MGNPRRGPSRLSWFPFYVDDYLGGVSSLCPGERGAYVSALCAQWQSKGLQAIEDDPERLTMICGPGAFTRAVRDKFKSIVVGGAKYLRNERLAMEWAKAYGEHQGKSTGGGRRDTAPESGADTGAESVPESAPDTATTTHNPQPITQSPPATAHTPPEENDLVPQRRDLRPQARALFAYWQSRTNHPGAQLTEQRMTYLLARLKEEPGTAEQKLLGLRLAVDGAVADPWFNGTESGKAYLEFENIFVHKGRNRIETLQGKARVNGTALAHPKPPARSAAEQRRLDSIKAGIEGGLRDK